MYIWDTDTLRHISDMCRTRENMCLIFIFCSDTLRTRTDMQGGDNVIFKISKCQSEKVIKYYKNNVGYIQHIGVGVGVVLYCVRVLYPCCFA